MTKVISCLFFNAHLTTSKIKKNMKGIKLSTNFAVFLLFFGVAALEAFQTRNWIKAAFWVVIGIVFLMSDNLKKT